MSRSNPSDNISNPCTRWFEWHGSKGLLRWYDKVAKQNVEIKPPFPFFVLDVLSTVKGWHENSESGIYANEVRDTRQEVMIVRSFKGGELASGVYKTISDRVGNLGGYFVSSVYIAYRDETNVLQIGNLNLNGAALKAWMDFRKEKKEAIFAQAIKITGHTEGKKGSIVFRMPKFELFTATEDTNKEAIALDVKLQEYLRAYLARPKTEQAQVPAADLKAADAEFTRSENAAADAHVPPVRTPPPSDVFVDDSEIPF